VPYGDETMVAELRERLGELTGGKHSWLFGRRTYEELLSHWNAQGGPFKESLNAIHKYVASSSPTARLEWPNSTLLHGAGGPSQRGPALRADEGAGAGRRQHPGVSPVPLVFQSAGASSRSLCFRPASARRQVLSDRP
jgi:hypothetical protein